MPFAKNGILKKVGGIKASKLEVDYIIRWNNKKNHLLYVKHLKQSSMDVSLVQLIDRGKADPTTNEKPSD